ncbi:unnamed protein product [Closterium sp. NIES-54]
MPSHVRRGPALSGVSQVDAVEPVEVTGDSGAAAGAAPGGAGTGGTEPGGAEPGGAVPGGPETGGAEPGGPESGGAEPGGAGVLGAAPGSTAPEGAPPGGTLPRRESLSPPELHEWFARRWRRAAGARGSSAAEGAAASGPGGARPGCPGAPGPEGSSGAGTAAGVGAEATTASPPRGATGGPAAGGAAVGAAGGAAGGAAVGAAGGATGGAAGGTAGAGSPAWGAGAVPAVLGVAARPRPYFVPLLQQVLGPPPPPSLERPLPVQSQLLPASPLPAPSPYTVPTGGLTERRAPASRPASPVRPARTSGRGSRQLPPPVPGTHRMSLRPSTAPLRVPLPSPPESSLRSFPDPASDSLRAASPTVALSFAVESDADWVRKKEVIYQPLKNQGQLITLHWQHIKDSAFAREKALNPHAIEFSIMGVSAAVELILIHDRPATYPLTSTKRSAFLHCTCLHRVLHPITGAVTDVVKGLVYAHLENLNRRWIHMIADPAARAKKLLVHYPTLSCSLCGGKHYDKYHDDFVTEHQNKISKWNLTLGRVYRLNSKSSSLLHARFPLSLAYPWVVAGPL